MKVILKRIWMNHYVDRNSANRVEWSKYKQRRGKTKPVDCFISTYHHKTLEKKLIPLVITGLKTRPNTVVFIVQQEWTTILITVIK